MVAGGSIDRQKIAWDWRQWQVVAAIVKVNIAETTQHRIVFDEMLQRCWSLRWLVEEKLHVRPHFS